MEQRGFGLLMVLLVMVVASLIITAVVALYERSQMDETLAIRQVRAVAAAHAGLEWATAALNDPADPTAASAMRLPACWSPPRQVALPDSLAEFTVTVACRRWPEGSGAVAYQEGGRQIAIYRLEAEAVAGASETVERVVRRLARQIERCKDPASIGPNHTC